MQFKALKKSELNQLKAALEANAGTNGTDGCALMTGADTSFVGTAPDLPTDEEVVRAIKSIPCHYCLALLAALLLPCLATADEFTDRLAQFEATTAKMKKACDCGGPADCSCGAKIGDCTCPPCLAAKTKAEKPKKAPLLYKHVCGCPSMSCNCAPLGGCHCSENAMFNRVNPTWQASPSGGYSLWRGNEQLGYYDGKTYWPLNADGEWCEPARSPIPLPRQQSSAVPSARLWIAPVSGGVVTCRS